MTRAYGNRKRTKADKRAAAIQYLTFKRELTGDEVVTLERSYGLSPMEAVELFNKIRKQRA